LRSGMTDCSSAVLHRVAAGGVTFIGGARRICRDERDTRRIDDEFFRSDLYQCSLYALAQLSLAGQYSHIPFFVNADPRVEEGFGLEAAGQRRLAGRFADVLCFLLRAT